MADWIANYKKAALLAERFGLREMGGDNWGCWLVRAEQMAAIYDALQRARETNGEKGDSAPEGAA